MEDFKLDLSNILSRFLERQIDFMEYVAARDAAVARAMLRLTENNTPQLRALMQATNGSVVQEMIRRIATDQPVLDDEPVVDLQPDSHILPALRLA